MCAKRWPVSYVRYPVLYSGLKICYAENKSTSSTTEGQTQKVAWTCSFRCKSLSDKEVAMIVSLKQIFHDDIPEI